MVERDHLKPYAARIAVPTELYDRLKGGESSSGLKLSGAEELQLFSAFRREVYKVILFIFKSGAKDPKQEDFRNILLKRIGALSKIGRDLRAGKEVAQIRKGLKHTEEQISGSERDRFHATCLEVLSLSKFNSLFPENIRSFAFDLALKFMGTVSYMQRRMGISMSTGDTSPLDHFDAVLTCVLYFEPERGFRFNTYLIKSLKNLTSRTSGANLRETLVGDFYGKVLSDTQSPTVIDSVSASFETTDLHHALTMMSARSPRLAKILGLRFGVGSHQHTLRDIGLKLKISMERVRQLEEKGLKILREILRKSASAADNTPDTRMEIDLPKHSLDASKNSARLNQTTEKPAAERTAIVEPTSKPTTAQKLSSLRAPYRLTLAIRKVVLPQARAIETDQRLVEEIHTFLEEFNFSRPVPTNEQIAAELGISLSRFAYLHQKHEQISIRLQLLRELQRTGAHVQWERLKKANVRKAPPHPA